MVSHSNKIWELLGWCIALWNTFYEKCGATFVHKYICKIAINQLRFDTQLNGCVWLGWNFVWPPKYLKHHLIGVKGSCSQRALTKTHQFGDNGCDVVCSKKCHLNIVQRIMERSVNITRDAMVGCILTIAHKHWKLDLLIVESLQRRKAYTLLSLWDDL